MVNNALRIMDYDTKVDVCGHGFQAMAYSSQGCGQVMQLNAR